MQFTLSATALPLSGRAASARGRVSQPPRGRVSLRRLNATTKQREKQSAETEEDLGPYGNGYKPYPLPFGNERVYVWERPPGALLAVISALGVQLNDLLHLGVQLIENGPRSFSLTFPDRTRKCCCKPAGVDASKIFKPRAVPTNNFEQCVLRRA